MNEWTLLAAGFVYGANLLSIVGIIFVHKKDMSVTFAWLMALIFLPFIGFLLYFFFGSTTKLQVMSKKYRMDILEETYGAILKNQIKEIQNDQMEYDEPVTERYQDMIIMNSRNSMSLFLKGNHADLLIDGQGKFPRMFQEIEEAKETINVLYFIIKSRDEIGKQFIELLAKKAAQGVKVKVVYDGFGWLKTRKKDFDPIVKAGGEVQRFLPSMLRNILLINYRLHRKMVVIDGRIAYTGGINVGDDYLGLYPKITPWRDTSIRLTGPAVLELQIRFFVDWVFLEMQDKTIQNPVHKQDFSEIAELYFRKPDLSAGDMGVQVLSCGPDSQYATIKDSYVKLVSSAKDYIYIQTPYFVPDQTLMDTLRLAANSGVDVRIMIPGIPDKMFVYYIAMSYIEELLEAGIKVYAHKGFLHAKTFVSDDHVSSIGTTNVDIRSFRLDYEVNTLVYSTSFAVQCRDTFLSDVEDCTEFEIENYRKRSSIHKFGESVCRLVGPLA